MSAAQFADVPEIKRIRFGRPMVIPPGGGKPVAYTRCTTYVGALEDTYNLGQWQQRMAVAGIAMRPDLHLRAVSLGAPPAKAGTPESANAEARWKAQMNPLVDEAREAAAASSAATIGTSLHALTEVIDRGQELNWNTVPDRYKTHLANYQTAMAGLHSTDVELFTVNDEHQVAGTADRLVNIDGHEGVFIADIKTGSIDYGAGKIAMQLSMYAHSERYDIATGARSPLEGIRLDRGVVIHLDAATGECTLHWVDIAAAWEAVAIAGWVRTWRKRKGLIVPATDLNPNAQPTLTTAPLTQPTTDAEGTGIHHPEDATTEAIEQAIALATCRDELLTLWQEATARGLWTDAMTQAASSRADQLQANVA